MSAAAFLRALWGERPAGHIQLWTLADRTSVYLTDPAAAANFEGHADVYCAVGMTARRLGAKQRAKADQVAALFGLWLDLDVKPGEIPTRDGACDLAHAHIEPTILVCSGYGIHAYYLFEGGPWIFRSVQERAEAASLAARFYALHAQTAAQRGWHLDQSTRDLARLLRLPGTLNAKDPDRPRPVVWLGVGCEVGPRHRLDDLRALLADVQAAEPGAPSSRAPVTLTGDTSAFAAKLDALLDNSPEFAAVWTGQRTFPSLSEADLSLCSMAAGAMTDPELAQLIYVHRQQHGDEDDKAKGRRLGYLRPTIRRARSRSERETQIAALDSLGREAA